jgi:DNA-binding response OmpR family regulator
MPSADRRRWRSEPWPAPDRHQESHRVRLLASLDRCQVIDVFICKLRKKLGNASHGQDYIETVWGRGYVLREPYEEKVKISA